MTARRSKKFKPLPNIVQTPQYWALEFDIRTSVVERLDCFTTLQQAKDFLALRVPTLLKWEAPDGTTTQRYWSAVAPSKVWLIEVTGAIELAAPLDDVAEAGEAGAESDEGPPDAEDVSAAGEDLGAPRRRSQTFILPQRGR